jgi:hypothetical protein
MGVEPYERTANLSNVWNIHSGIIKLCSGPDQMESEKIIHPSYAGKVQTGWIVSFATVAVPLRNFSVRSQSVGSTLALFIMCDFLVNYITNNLILNFFIV